MKNAIVLILLAGCAGMAAQSRSEELQAKLAKMIQNHNTDEQIASAWGPPTKRDKIGELEFWTYYRSYGSRSSGVIVGSTYVGNASDRFDEMVLEFRDGVLVNAKVRVAR